MSLSNISMMIVIAALMSLTASRAQSSASGETKPNDSTRSSTAALNASWLDALLHSNVKAANHSRSSKQRVPRVTFASQAILCKCMTA